MAEKIDKRVMQRVLRERSNEAKNLITSLLAAGMKMDDIARRAHVNQRTIYRWLNENHTPHPILLEALRRMQVQEGETE